VNYRQALEALFRLRRFGVRPGLGPMRALLARLGNPERDLDVVHIAGTNGKGSTAAFVEAIARAAGLSTGLYTSPHLVRFTERVRVDGDELGEEEAAALAEETLRAAEGLPGDPPTFFEHVTAMALLAFRRRGVGLAILECGLGGRLDATNVIAAPRACAVTSIGPDHLDVLGPTLADVAREKGGIGKPGVPLVAACRDEAARAALVAEAESRGARVLVLGRDVRVAAAGEALRYDGPGGPLEVERLALAGAHQRDNAAVALALSSLAGVVAPGPAGDEARRRGLAEARWPGRLEELAPDLVVDGAHNPEGAAALATWLLGNQVTKLPSDQVTKLPRDPVGRRPVVLLLGVVADKDVGGLLAPLLPLVDRIVATTAPSARAMAAAALAERVRTLTPSPPVDVEPDVAAALARARAMAIGRGGRVVACGSLFLVGEVRRLVTGERADPIVVQDPMGANWQAPFDRPSTSG
jgi:dihydrofolate synthase/folylpolyglutamate synthase